MFDKTGSEHSSGDPLYGVNLVDFSQPWSSDSPPFPGQAGVRLSYERRLSSHRVNVQRLDTTMHVGTHLDAPLHFVTNGADIESLGFDVLAGPCAIVDLSGVTTAGTVITASMLEDHLVDYSPGDGLFIYTGFSRHSMSGDDPDEIRYFYHHPGPDRSFAEWCLKHGVRILGIDAPSMDHPMNTMLRTRRSDIAGDLARAGGISSWDEAFPASDFQIMHTLLFPRGLVHVENLSHTIGGFVGRRLTVGVFPWRFRGGEAAMCRVVAFVPDA